jgi:hypothetical protein
MVCSFVALLNSELAALTGNRSSGLVLSRCGLFKRLVGSRRVCGGCSFDRGRKSARCVDSRATENVIFKACFGSSVGLSSEPL